MNSLADLRPGDIGFTSIPGAVGLGISLGELILGDGFRIGKLDVRHVFVVTKGVDLPGPDGYIKDGSAAQCVEAMPSGAVETWFAQDRWTPEYAYARLPEDYPGQAADAAAIARAMIGTPYSFASYAALAAWRLGLKTKRLESWIDRRRPVGLPSDLCLYRDEHCERGACCRTMQLPAEAICSVLADQAWTLAGKQVMPAGTPHQCVTPGALAKALLEMDGAKWMWPR